MRFGRGEGLSLIRIHGIYVAENPPPLLFAAQPEIARKFLQPLGDYRQVGVGQFDIERGDSRCWTFAFRRAGLAVTTGTNAEFSTKPGAGVRTTISRWP